MAALKTDQLACLLHCLVSSGTHVLGVFPADCLPVRLVEPASAYSRKTVIVESNVSTLYAGPRANQNFCFILNTHPNSRPGEHWIAFFYNVNTHKLEYFDSFGLSIGMYAHVHSALGERDLLDICLPANATGMLQSITTTVCGHYAVLFLCHRSKYASAPISRFAQIISRMHSNGSERDKLVVEQLRSLTSLHPCCNTQLFAARAGARVPCMATSSQSCCCRADWRTCSRL